MKVDFRFSENKLETNRRFFSSFTWKIIHLPIDITAVAWEVSFINSWCFDKWMLHMKATLSSYILNCLYLESILFSCMRNYLKMPIAQKLSLKRYHQVEDECCQRFQNQSVIRFNIRVYTYTSRVVWGGKDGKCGLFHWISTCITYKDRKSCLKRTENMTEVLKNIMVWKSKFQLPICVSNSSTISISLSINIHINIYI